jgi:hypothetical protein
MIDLFFKESSCLTAAFFCGYAGKSFCRLLEINRGDDIFQLHMSPRKGGPAEFVKKYNRFCCPYTTKRLKSDICHVYRKFYISL